MSLQSKCTFYKNAVEHNGKQLINTGKVVSIFDLLNNERYTNGKLLNELRIAGYGSQFYKDNKKRLSAACFSSVQDDLSIDRSDANHLFHTGYIAFDIDTADNPYLLTDGESIKEYIIENMPFVAYLGKSVSNLGYWGLFPILNKDDHYGHYGAMKDYFKSHSIIIDQKTSDISRLRFLAYDPDGFINNDAKVFCEALINVEQTTTIDEYERPNVTDELFISACRWIEVKYDIKFQKGSIHNYLLYLYSTLRACHVPRHKILNWIYNNLIDESQITTNCLQETKWKK